jgi:hypothetical protein
MTWEIKWDNVRKGKETRCVGGRGKMIVVGNVEADRTGGLGRDLEEAWRLKGTRIGLKFSKFAFYPPFNW